MPAILAARMISLLLWWEYRVLKVFRANKALRVRLALLVRKGPKASRVCKVRPVPLVRRDLRANKVRKVKLVLLVRKALRESKVLQVWAFHRRSRSMEHH